MKLLIVIAAIFAVASSRPSFIPKNIVTVPPNCPAGQVWLNGQCRDVWRFVTASPTNVVTVPPNCPTGQEWVNGECRDVWIRNLISQSFLYNDEQKNVITVPENCKDGQEWVNGECRDVWRNYNDALKNVVTVPPNCPAGQEYINGECRDVWIRFIQDDYDVIYGNAEEHDPSSRNVIDVPNQCPNGYKPDALGNCREVIP